MLERNLNDIKLPTLNITPKVHKLTDRADINSERTLKGRPIVNGYATVNTEPSKLLDKLSKTCLNNMMVLFHRKEIHYPKLLEVLDKS